MKWVKKIVIPAFLIVTFLVVILATFPLTETPLLVAHAAVIDEINDRNKQIDEIQQQIEQYQQQLDALGGKSLTLENEIAKLNGQINQAQLEIKSLSLSITQTESQISLTQGQIDDAQTKIDLNKATLAKLMTILYQTDQENLTRVFLKNGSLSDFFNEITNLKSTQENVKNVLDQIKSLKADLEVKEDDLGDKKSGLEDLRQFQESQKKAVDSVKKDRANILSQTKGQESKYQELVKQSQQNIARIKEEIFYLSQNGVTVEDAIKFGNLAAISTGIRPAFLIAELEVESSLGKNVGRCNRAGDPPEKGWRSVMNPTRDQQPFLAITASLGLNPDTTPVSCRQYVNGKPFGWGGAMGPAQFIPSTWMGYKDQVAQITGHNPANPWNIQDAFTASAVKLAKAGATAKTRAAEVAASKAYYSGNSKCSSVQCNSYANSVQRVAADIEQNL